MRSPLAIARADALRQPRPTRSLAALLLFTLATVIAPQSATASEFPRCLGVAAAGASDKCPPVLYDVFARGLDNSLVHKQFREGTGWTGWVSLGGVLGGDPGAASWSGGAIDIFARGLDSSLVHKQFRETTGWTGWIGHGGSLAGDPSVSEWGPGSLDVFARASNGTVVDKQFREASGWTWASLGTAPAGDPIAVSWGSGAIDLFARGTDGALWQRQYRAATGWTGWMSRGGIIAGDPAVVTWGPGAIDVFARRASDNALVSMQYRDATGWSGWALRSPTPLGSDPAAVSPYRGGIDVFATDTAGQVMSMQYRDAHGWTGWASLGGIIRGTPTVTTWKYRYTSWRYGGTDRIINTTDEAQALKAAVEGAAPTERDELLADLSPGEAAFFIQTAYPTSWQYGGANHRVDTDEVAAVVAAFGSATTAADAAAILDGLDPEGRVRVDQALSVPDEPVTLDDDLGTLRTFPVAYRGPNAGWFTTHGDYVHISKDPPLALSAHGWWKTKVGKPSSNLAKVTVRLQQHWGSWTTVDTGSATVAPGGGRGKRATARRECTRYSGYTYSYRSVIDVDIVDAEDTPDTVTTPVQKDNCSALGKTR